MIGWILWIAGAAVGVCVLLAIARLLLTSSGPTRMFGCFAVDSRKSMALARRAALHHDTIEVPHILIGALEAGGGAERIVTSLGLSPQELVTEVRSCLPPGTASEFRGQIPFAPAGKDVLETTIRMMDEFGHERAHSGHVLLAILEVGGPCAELLASHGVTAAAVREELRGLA